MKTDPLGQVRLTAEELMALPWRHWISGADPEPGWPGGCCGRISPIHGYTEWLGPEPCAITLGWDWQVQVQRHPGTLRRSGLPRSNMQLLDGRGRLLRWDANLTVLATVVDALPWQIQVQHLFSHWANP